MKITFNNEICIRKQSKILFAFLSLVILIYSIHSHVLSQSSMIVPTSVENPETVLSSMIEENLHVDDVLSNARSNYNLNTQEQTMTIPNNPNISTSFEQAFKETYFGSPIHTDQQDIKSNEIFPVAAPPRVTILESNFTEINDITIPVIAKEDATNFEVKYTTKTVSILIGIDYSFEMPEKYSKKYEDKLEFGFEGTFKFHIRVAFPFELEVTFPEAVIEGTKGYTVSSKLNPVDKLNYDEFVIDLDMDFIVYINGKAPMPGIKCKYLVCWPTIKWKWMNLGFAHVDYKYSYQDSYQPKLGDEPTVIEIPGRINIIEKIKDVYPPWTWIIDKVISAGIEFGSIKLSDSFVTAKMEVLGNLKKTECDIDLTSFLPFYADILAEEHCKTVYTDIQASKRAIWDEPNKIQSLSFDVGTNSKGQLAISISNFELLVYKMQSVPRLYFEFKDQDLIHPAFPWKEIKLRLKEYTGGTHRVDLPAFLGGFSYEATENPKAFDISSGSLTNPLIFEGEKPLIFPSTDSFKTKITAIPPEDFNIEVVAKDITPTDIHRSLNKLYEITFSSEYPDTVKFRVSGLPTGWTATFDRKIARYDVGTTPKKALLVITPPEHIISPPGIINFNIRATSLTKEEYNLPNPTIEHSVPLTVPEIIDYALNMVNIDNHTLEVFPNSEVSIQFLGNNLGNQNDTILLNATLFSDMANYTWTRSCSVAAYGKSGAFYDGNFDFMYGLTGVYPSPGVYRMDIEARSLRNPSQTKTYVLFLNFMPSYSVKASITPNEVVMHANWMTSFEITLNNTGNQLDNFTLVTSGWDDYLILPDVINNVEPMAKKNVTMQLKIPHPAEVPVKTYEFRIMAESEKSNGTDKFYVGDVSVTILSPDYIPPGLEYLEPPYSGKANIYPTTSLTLGPTWKAIDDFPGQCTIYIDENVYSSFTWSNDTIIKVPVTGSNQLAVGMHNITLVLTDTSGNIAKDQLWITITESDTVAPTITGKPEETTLPENFMDDYQLWWNITETHLYNVTLYRNGNYLPLNEFGVFQCIINSSCWFINHSIHTSTLMAGSYNYTLALNDMNNNKIITSTIITISSIDDTDPEVTQIPASSGVQSAGESIFITAADEHPKDYELWINTALEKTGTWQSGSACAFYLDTLSLLETGQNDLEVRFRDWAGNVQSYSWTFNYRDIDPPVVVTAPTDFTIFEHNITRSQIPFWKVSDMNPANYSIYLAGELVTSGSWGIASEIGVPIHQLSAGVYQFDAYFNDTGGYTLHSTVEVTIKDVLPPYIWEMDTIYFDPMFTADWLEFIVTDAHPNNYELYKEGNLVDEGSITSDFPFVFMRIAETKPGNYTYLLRALDKAGNVGEREVDVVVLDFTPPYIVTPEDIIFSEGTTGHTLVYEFNEANPHNYSLYRNTELVETETAITGNVSISIDDLELGMYDYVFVLYDINGHAHAVYSTATVIDATCPHISKIADCRFVVGASHAKLTWDVSERHPASYSIKRGETIIRNETWDGSAISMAIVGWTEGIHDIELTVKDTSGNIATDTVSITIVEEEIVSTHKVIIQSSGFGFITMLAVMTILAIIPYIRIKYRRK